MAALTADVDHPHKGNLDEYKLTVLAVTTDVFYKGAIVYADAATGYAQVSVPAAGDVFIGICAKQVSAVAGTRVEIYTGGLWALNMTTPTEAEVGDVVFMDVNVTPTDNIADAYFPGDAALEANDILIGKMLAIDIEETTRGWVKIDPGWIYSTTLGWV